MSHVEMRRKKEEERFLGARRNGELGRAWLLLMQAGDDSRSMKTEKEFTTALL